MIGACNTHGSDETNMCNFYMKTRREEETRNDCTWALEQLAFS